MEVSSEEEDNRLKPDFNNYSSSITYVLRQGDNNNQSADKYDCYRTYRAHRYKREQSEKLFDG
jgi:hypothetical protein